MERELKTTLKLVDLALKRFPSIFSSRQHVSIAMKMLRKLMPLFMIQRLRCAMMML